MYYAQIDDAGCVFAVSELAGSVIGQNMIEIDGLDSSLIGATWDGSAFIKKTASTVPSSVTMKQARLALLAAGLLDDIDATIKASNRESKIEWEYASEVRRDHPLIASMQQARGLTDAEVDALFTAAAGM